MASVSRQPFAPLDGARLQTLTSLINRQNALTPSSNIKRKAELLDTNDFENVDPCLFAKRSKGASGTPTKDMAMKKPSACALTKAAVVAAATTPATTTTPGVDLGAFITPMKAASAGPRRTLQPKSPLAKFNTNAAKSSPVSAPAGRSPNRGKRPGLLSSRCPSTGSFTRVDPPSFPLQTAAPFSLDAAIKGTIPTYSSRPRSNALSSKASASVSSPLVELDMRADWFFDIHEDTPEQEMTNILQHSTCVLDISSDEENEQKARRERAEGRDKENVPPSGDRSQTSTRRSARAVALDDMAMEKRVVLSEIKPTDVLAPGLDKTSVIIIPGDDDDEPLEHQWTAQVKNAQTLPVDGITTNSEARIGGDALLQPIEGTGENFELWESGSAKDDAGLAATET